MTEHELTDSQVNLVKSGLMLITDSLGLKIETHLPELPKEAGAYVWYHPKSYEVLYVGSSPDLQRRLGKEIRLKNAFDFHEYASLPVIAGLAHHNAEYVYVITDTAKEARGLELLMRELILAATGLPVPLAGWETRPDTPRGRARAEAQRLIDEARAKQVHAVVYHDLIKDYLSKRQAEQHAKETT